MQFNIRIGSAEIEVTDIAWRIHLISIDHSTMFAIEEKKPMFEYKRGDNVIRYAPEFGQRTGLPGSILSTNFIRAVVVGYQENGQSWLLGLHLSRDASEQPTFRSLIRWPSGDSMQHAQEVRQVAQPLAVYLTCPLKVVGHKKLPRPNVGPGRSGVTGPLQPHSRDRIEIAAIRKRVDDMKLPIQGQNFTLQKGRNGPVLNLGKIDSQGQEESPAYNQCEVHTKQKKVLLLPPTGLLGIFNRPRGREIPFARIHNVEYRHVHVQVTTSVPSKDGKGTDEQITTRHNWGVYLTLKDESLLLLQLTFTESSDLYQTRVTEVAGDKFATNSMAGVEFYRRHAEEQEAIEARKTEAENVALVLADAIDCHVVKTEVER